MACDCQTPKTGFLFTRRYCERCGEKIMKLTDDDVYTVQGIYRHPLDRVESALVDASNALDDAIDAMDDYHRGSETATIDLHVDAVLREVQAIIRRDLNPSDPRD